MVVGNGLIATNMKNYLHDNRFLIFASGVSNSSEVSLSAFDRERSLVEEHLAIANKHNMLFIYFSSCALVDAGHLSIPYYRHKSEIEELINQQADNFIIFRLPQLIGKSENKNTLINYLIDKVKTGEYFELWKNATRYLIEVNDLKIILDAFLDEKSLVNQTIDIANPYRYRVEEIVNIIANYMHKKANYVLVNKKDSYELDLKWFLTVCDKKRLNISFGYEYLYRNLQNIIS